MNQRSTAPEIDRVRTSTPVDSPTSHIYDSAKYFALQNMRLHEAPPCSVHVPGRAARGAHPTPPSPALSRHWHEPPGGG